MSLVNKLFGARFKDLLVINNSNNGFDSNLDEVTSGNGNKSSLSLSENQHKIKPKTDSTTLSSIYDADGNLLFLVDSVNDLLKAGTGQQHINTQYAYYGVSSKDSSQFGGDHTPIPFGINNADIFPRFGTGTDPNTSFTGVAEGADIANMLWYIPDEIVIDAVHVWVGADASTGDTIRFHLMSYDIDTSNTSTGGDLSNGVVLADGSDITNAGYEQTYYQSMTIQSSSVTAGKVVLFLFRNDSTNSDYSINATVKYHLK